MSYTLAVWLLVLWLVGMVSGYTMGGFIHVFLVIAVAVLVQLLIAVVLVQLLTRRRVTP